MRMIIPTKKRSRPKSSKQKNLQILNVKYRLDNPAVYDSRAKHNLLNPLRGIAY